MFVRFQCPNCMSVVAIEESEMGQPAACGSCNRVVVVPSTRTSPGAIIGDFLIEREVGQGGLGTVYLTHQLSLDRPAALKILHDRYAQDDTFVMDFVREARAAAQLNHPNIVQAYAVGEDEGIHFFAMEYAQGSTLKQVLAHSGRLVIEKALRITYEMAQALDFAWKNKQLVHRDIKPDNIILTDDGVVKLADLGLARVQEDILSDDTGEILGTPQYISPEQLLGKPADNRSDIYSLGATLYHTITGQYPFQGKNPAEIARKHITETMKPPRSVIPEIPENVSKLVWIMMAKRPGHRYQSAEELLKDIELAQTGGTLSRKALQVFQKTIDLGRVDEELAATPSEDADAATIDDMQTQKNSSESMQEKDAKKPEDTNKKNGFWKRGKNKKNEKTKKSESRKKTTDDSNAKTSEKSPNRTVKLSTDGSPMKTRAAGASSARLKTGKKGNQGKSTFKVSGTVRSNVRRHSPTGEVNDTAGKNGAKKILFTVLGLAAALLLAMGLTIYFIADNAPELDQDGLTPEQRAVVSRFERRIENEPVEQMVSALENEAARKQEEQPALAQALKKLISPLLEKQARELREQIRKDELKAWREKSKEMIAEKRRREQELKQQAREEQRRQQELAEQERLRRLREERLARLREEQKELRKEALQLARKDRFYEAKLLFISMSSSKEAEFREWAKNKITTIEHAQKAINIVRDSGKLLEDTRIIIPGRIRPAYITNIDRVLIYAEIRDYAPSADNEPTIAKREPVSLKIVDLPTDRLVELMRTGWNLQNGRKNELDLMIGAFLLARGEKLDLAEQKLMATNQRDLADSMLDELKKIREIVQ